VAMMFWNSRMTRNPIFSPLFLAPFLVPSSSVCQTLTAAQEQTWRAQIRSNFFIPDPLPALAAQTHRRFCPAPGVSAEAVTYATQFGTRALGGDIPGYSRDDLNVFTLQEWEARKKEFILETWLQAAQEAIGGISSQQ